jgi:pyroglutamyl-peptidase
VVYVKSENTILLTGYSYYSKYWFNPSSEVASVLDGAVINGYRVVSRVFPVSFRVVVSELPRLLEELKPRIALGLGLDPRARQVQVELAAVNYVYSEVSDVDGAKLNFREIVPGSPRVVYSTLPVREIVEKCGARRLLPVRPSLGTGLFLCNVAGYLLMKHGVEKGVPAGFLHIPPSTVNLMRGETDYGVPLDTIVETVKCILEVAVENSRH